MTPRIPRPDLRDRKEQEILQAAAAVFAARGFRATRIDDIAAHAGIGKGTVYEYFQSKEHLFLRLFEWFTSQAFTSMSSEADDARGGSAMQGLWRACDSLLVSCGEMKELYPLTLEFWSASTAPEFREALSEEFRQIYVRFRGDIASRIRAAIAQGEVGTHIDAEAVAGVLVGALDGIVLQAWFDPAFDSLSAGRHFFDVIARGMAPHKEAT
jgi:TetR/AcrR family fatty acid metabolism transcriptional regulator